MRSNNHFDQIRIPIVTKTFHQEPNFIGRYDIENARPRFIYVENNEDQEIQKNKNVYIAMSIVSFGAFLVWIKLLL